ncbi:MAG: ATP phosphoribosyltransferase [Bacillota bacterium]|nr:ATP phosphoribosyltransferase [Bacillota bacterium]
MPIAVALPRGRMLPDALGLLAASGLPVDAGDAGSPDLVIEREGWRFLLARPRDVGLYVENGVADLGVAGKDTLLEHPRQVIELLDLKFGCCRLVLAVPAAAAHARTAPTDLRALRRVATKYPRLTEGFLQAGGSSAQVVEVHGAVEMAAALGLADAVVDLVQTGRTLKSNGLVETAVIVSSSARLVVNPVAFRVMAPELQRCLERLRQTVSARAGLAAAGPQA